MITAIGNILIEQLGELPFLDKVAGVVKTITYKDDGILKKLPASCASSEEDCRKGNYRDLCPDNGKKSVLYLEDKGLRLIKKEAGVFYWRASYGLVCWLNMPALGFSDCSYSAIAIMGILSKLPSSPIPSTGIYSRVNFIPNGEDPKNQNPFQKYTYEETINQFLLYPYDYFVLSIDVEFCVNKACLTPSVLQPPIPCKK